MHKEMPFALQQGTGFQDSASRVEKAVPLVRKSNLHPEIIHGMDVVFHHIRKMMDIHDYIVVSE